MVAISTINTKYGWQLDRLNMRSGLFVDPGTHQMRSSNSAFNLVYGPLF
jgi:hypothetical protein